MDSDYMADVLLIVVLQGELKKLGFLPLIQLFS